MVRPRSAKPLTPVQFRPPPPNYFHNLVSNLGNSSKIINKGFNNLASSDFLIRHRKSPIITEFGYFLATHWLLLKVNF